MFVLLCYSSSINAQYTESFENGIPANWTVINGGDASTWTAGEPADGAGACIGGTGVATLLYTLQGADWYDYFEQINVGEEHVGPEEVINQLIKL